MLSTQIEKRIAMRNCYLGLGYVQFFSLPQKVILLFTLEEEEKR